MLFFSPTKATDRDLPANSDILYHITGGDPDEHFSIDEVTGELGIVVPLDYEAMEPAAQGVILLTVMAEDGGSPSLNSTVSVYINVQVSGHFHTWMLHVWEAVERKEVESLMYLLLNLLPNTNKIKENIMMFVEKQGEFIVLNTAEYGMKTDMAVCCCTLKVLLFTCMMFVYLYVRTSMTRLHTSLKTRTMLQYLKMK